MWSMDVKVELILIYKQAKTNTEIIAQAYLPSKLYMVNKMLQPWLLQLMFPSQYSWKNKCFQIRATSF